MKKKEKKDQSHMSICDRTSIRSKGQYRC